MSYLLKCVVYLSLAVLEFSSCHSTMPEMTEEEPEETPDTVIFSERIAAGTLNNKSIDEASGMAMSIQHDSAFWTHNDSGDEARLFLISTTARYQLTCTLSGATNRDWEDIAVAKDPVNAKSRIYIGDIGDNSAIYGYGYIYILNEPAITADPDITVSDYDKITFRYEDGKRDAESLMVDPVNGDIYIVSKREANVGLYQIKYPYSFTDTTIAKKVLTMPYTQIVGGDISADGSEILLKNYDTIWYWPRKNGQSVAEALNEKPTEPPYTQEPQGEAICWSRDSKAFYTMSEASLLNITPVLYRYEKK
ncbi:MAG: hypothetical protein H7X99_07155 [Saprospiraceae bacterium]|nr:hypothetical protein [Saprospiraceae bacterium]